MTGDAVRVKTFASYVTNYDKVQDRLRRFTTVFVFSTFKMS